MPFSDLQNFIAALESKKLLRRIKTEVSQDLEISEITDRVVKSGGPALLRERQGPHDPPRAINLFGPTSGWRSRGLPDRLTSFVALQGGFLDKIALKLMEAASFLPKHVSDGPCKYTVLKGDAVDLGKFPILKCWPQDGGRFITFPCVFTYDPETGRRNVGTYRMQVYDKRTTGMHFHPHKDGARHLRKAKAPLQAAAVIGADPAVCFAATLPLPPDMDEILFAGVIRQEGVKLVKCETVDIEVPANSEIVLEGTIDPGSKRTEGPFGDHTGYYSLADEFPVFNVTAITHRQKPVYHTIVVGPPVQEDCFMGGAIERLFLPLMKMQLHEVVDYHMPYEGIFHNLMIVSIRKQYPGHARKVMHAICCLPQAMFSKVIVVVDEDAIPATTAGRVEGAQSHRS
jgi:4-hydroxy-3-polyprenylbenzoate decarboxylase